MRLLLIAGHGDGDSGACGNGYREADLTREDVALLEEKLRGKCDVSIADMSKNWFEYLKTHSCDFSTYDYVLEVHFNAGGGKGTEIYVTTSEQRVDVERAIVKNIEGVGFINRGVKRRNFNVISEVKRQGVSSALLEVCFIDSASDVELYQAEKNAVIRAIANGIVEGFGLSGAVEKAHWADKYFNALDKRGYLTEKAWKYFDCDIPVAHALALLDKTSGGRWGSDEADASVHWAQPIIISLCGKGLISDKELYLNLVKRNANLSNALCLALLDKMSGGMRDVYVGRNTDHWARNCLDSLCDKAAITTPKAWENFDAATSYGRFMAVVCNVLHI